MYIRACLSRPFGPRSRSRGGASDLKPTERSKTLKLSTPSPDGHPLSCPPHHSPPLLPGCETMVRRRRAGTRLVLLLIAAHGLLCGSTTSRQPQKLQQEQQSSSRQQQGPSRVRLTRQLNGPTEDSNYAVLVRHQELLACCSPAVTPLRGCTLPTLVHARSHVTSMSIGVCCSQARFLSVTSHPRSRSCLPPSHPLSDASLNANEFDFPGFSAP